MNNLFYQLKNNPDLIKDLNPEREDVEFKSNFWWETEKSDYKIEIAKDFAAMINRGGGLFIIGVTEHKDKGILEITGIQNPNESIKQRIAQVIQYYLEPKFDLKDIEYVECDGKIICLIPVPSFEDIGIVSVINKERNNLLEFWKRRQTNKMPISYMELENMFFYKITGINYAKVYLENQIERYKKEWKDYYPIVVIQLIPTNFREENLILNEEEIDKLGDLSYVNEILEKAAYSSSGFYDVFQGLLDFQRDTSGFIKYIPEFIAVPLGRILLFGKNHQNNNKIPLFFLEAHKNGYVACVCLKNSKFFEDKGVYFSFDDNKTYWRILIRFAFIFGNEFLKMCNREKFLFNFLVLRNDDQKILYGSKDLIENKFYDILNCFDDQEKTIKTIFNYIPKLWGYPWKIIKDKS
jgi:hypothetical protein